MASPPTHLVRRLEEFDQLHLLRWWDDLDDSQRHHLSEEIESVDLDSITSVWKSAREDATGEQEPAVSRAESACAPQSVVFRPTTEQDHQARRQAADTGQQLLASGQIAVITVAGGQGSRLGFDHPKGMFPIGPVSDRTLFQIFAEQIHARRLRHGGDILWMIMTSAATHAETIEFFEQQDFFGMSRETVAFFQQGSMPAVDDQSGRILMNGKSTLCLSPDGHGGMLGALKSSGLLDRLQQTGVEHVYYHQVDNPTAIICDPVLLGLHEKHGSQMTTAVVCKTEPAEAMGVLVDLDGCTQIIEYSELTPEQAAREDESGQWIFWAGNTAVHVFSRSFLEQLTREGSQLTLHLAHKKVEHLDDSGTLVSPTEPNAHKFERFIFDALPMAEQTLIVEGDRDREFNPVKNAEGKDSPATSKAALHRIAQEWLSAAGRGNSSARVEISPLQALDAEEFAAKLKSGALRMEDLPVE